MKIQDHIKRFRKAQEGAILVLWGVSFAVILGFVALSFDLGRVGITQTELQAYADSVALAAAGELDGGADAITRATNAAANMITDSQTFGNGGPVLSGAGDYSISFYSDLPANDTAAMTAVTTDPAQARYVRVVVITETVALTFGAAFNALRGDPARDMQVNASAVAGFTSIACDVTPLMFCVPPGFKAENEVGTMILLRSGGSGAAWGPGDFGFLDPSTIPVDPNGPCGGLNGVQLDACLIGATGSITQCFSQNGVNTQPGQRVGIEDAIFNVRFDIYKAIMNGKRNDARYAPAPNVIKGIVPNGGGNCIGGSPQAATDSLGLPRDDCFTANTCTRFGNGIWNRTAYVNMNYGGADPHPAPGVTTRWQYYNAEIATNGGVSGTNRIIDTPRRETGRRQCSNRQDPNAYRRVVTAAAINCTANPINGAEVGVPVEEFVELFITEPVGTDAGSPPTLDLWVEVIGSAGNGAGGAGLFRDFVQLYR